jgi:MYXO-CTERM domain-containing protein
VSDFTVSPGDARLVLSWTSTDEEDISSYRLYLSETPFTEDDEELPTLTIEGTDGDVDYPLDVPAGEPSSGHSTELTELSNGATYWVAVQPIDASDNLGPMSLVLSSAPEQTCGLVECYGDRGCSCSSTGSQPGLLSLALLALTLLGVRRRA